MITNNFRALCGTMLQSLGNNRYGLLPMTTVAGDTVYCACNFTQYPASVATTYTANANASGIHLGTGTRAASGADYALHEPITNTAITATVTYARGVDGNDPYVEFTIVVTNGSPDSITIAEIGYYQPVAVVPAFSNTSGSNVVVCLDRSLLDTPVTIPQGVQKAIVYTLKTTGI